MKERVVSLRAGWTGWPHLVLSTLLVATLATALVPDADAKSLGKPKTASAESGASWVDLAYSRTSRRFLVAYSAKKGPSQREIFARVLDEKGRPLGPSFQVSSVDAGFTSRTNASVAWLPDGDRFLVVWQGQTPNQSRNQIHGRVVTPQGTVPFSPIRISSQNSDGTNDDLAEDPEVIANEASGEFLVLWNGIERRDANAGFEVYGNRRSPDGDNRGGPAFGIREFRVSSTGPDLPFDGRSVRDEPRAAATSTGEYLVAWSSNHAATALSAGFGDPAFHVFGKQLAASGAELSSDFKISRGSATINQRAVRVASDGSRRRTLALYDFARGTTEKLFGQRLKGSSRNGKRSKLLSSPGPGDLVYGVKRERYVASAENRILVLSRGKGRRLFKPFRLKGAAETLVEGAGGKYLAAWTERDTGDLIGGRILVQRLNDRRR